MTAAFMVFDVSRCGSLRLTLPRRYNTSTR